VTRHGRTLGYNTRSLAEGGRQYPCSYQDI
jgi:hypothetical protein